MSKRTEDVDEFRLRPTRPRARNTESSAWSKALTTVLRYARASKRVASGATAGVAGGRSCNQRCAVRVMYSSNKVSGQWRAHGRYIAREAVTGDHQTAGFGSPGEAIPPGETLARWQSAGDPRLWKVILSPEFGERIDLDQMTREVMARMERDLGTKLEWVAVAHFNTSHPHVHVALRGVRGDGSALKLPRDYVRSGIRQHAEKACTLQLGLRTALDAASAERKEVGARRFTSLDRWINRASTIDHSKTDAHHFVFVLASPRRTGASMDRHQNVLARLQTLRSMGLAEEFTSEIWRIRRDFEIVLKAMQRVADRQKMLAKHGALLSDERLPVEVLDFRKLRTVEGRVLVHGEDEHSGRAYLLLEGIDAKVHLIHHTNEIFDARSHGQLRPNAFVRLRRRFENGRPLLEIEDHGDADRLLRNKSFVAQRAREAARGTIPSQTGWGGWLGRFEATMAGAARAEVRDQTLER